MIMSEYDYTIQWLPGVDNPVGDNLSRLIKIPDDEWNTIEKDDDTVHPFLMTWTQLLGNSQTLTQLCATLQTDTAQSTDVQQTSEAGECQTFPTICMLAEQNRAISSVCTHCGQRFGSRNLLFKHLRASHGLKKVRFAAAVPQIKRTTQDRAQQVELAMAREEQKMHLAPDMPHERLLFSAHRVHVETDLLKLSERDYLQDPEFKLVYTILRKQQKHAERALKHSKTVSHIRTAKIPDVKHTAGERRSLSLAARHYLEKGLLYRRFRNRTALCVPDVQRNDQKNLRWMLFSEYHDTGMAGHRGLDATHAALSRRFHWKNMKQDVQKYIGACETCQQHKIRRQRKNTKITIMQLPSKIGESYNLDFITDLPPSGSEKHDQILTIVDRFSQRVFCIPTHSEATAADIAQTFYDVIVCEHGRGVPKELISDRDKLFVSKMWQAVQQKCGTCVRMSSARQQSTNGGAERQNAVIEEIMAMYLNYAQDNWVEILPQLTFAMNDSPSAALGNQRTPLLVEHGHHPIRAMDLHDSLKMDEDAPAPTDQKSVAIQKRIDRMKSLHQQVYDAVEESRLNMKDAHDERRRVKSELLKPGMKAWLDIHGLDFSELSLRPKPKLNPKFYGPFTIVSQPGENRFRLELPADSKAHPVFHVSRLKPWTDPDMVKYKNKPRKLPKKFTEGDVLEVDVIHDDDLKYNIQWYLVQWKGWPRKQDWTWQSKDDLLPGSSKLLDEYNSKQGITAGGGRRKKARTRRS
eukprot:SAG31_NODE_3_length_45830_cov_42.279701_28_plen_748_part_00